MRKFNKMLAGAAAVAALTTAVGVAFADTTVDPQDTPMANTDTATGAHIYTFKNEGNSPETDPAAHLILIKPAAPMAAPVAQVEQAPVVAQADTSSTQSMPAASDTTTTDTSTDSTPVPADTAPTPAPKADRN